MGVIDIGDVHVRDYIQAHGTIEIRSDCKGCDQCVKYCPADAIVVDGLGTRHQINHDLCVNCGQCLVNCPFDRIDEVSMVDYVMDAINDPKKHVITQAAPSVRVGLGEEFGAEPGTNVEGKMHAAERAVFGNDKKKNGGVTVWDTNFAADLTITEEGFEFIERLWNYLGVPGYEHAGPLPQTTSCCPGWVRFFETRYPDLLDHISSARSPVMMFGPVAKTYGAEKLGIDGEDIFQVAISPCEAKKFEVTRPEFISAGLPKDRPADVDAVVTTREFAQMIRDKGLDFNSLEDGKVDPGMGEETGAAIIFGNTGGVMEAALRTAYEVLSGEKLEGDAINLMACRGEGEVRVAEIPIPIKALDGKVVNARVAIVHGSKNVDKLMREVRTAVANGDEPPYHFIEVMNCPGGCINGGGQPIRHDVF